MEPYLRTNLGLPTSLKNGVIHLEKDFSVCNSGDTLTPEQAKILVKDFRCVMQKKLLDMKLSEFHFKLVCVWSDGKVKKF